MSAMSISVNNNSATSGEIWHNMIKVCHWNNETVCMIIYQDYVR